MQPIDIDIHTAAPRPPVQPRSLLLAPPHLLAALSPQSLEDAAARAVGSIGGGICVGAVSRAVAWGPESCALALLMLLALVMGFGFVWRFGDRRLAYGLGAYALLGAIGTLLAIGFGG